MADQDPLHQLIVSMSKSEKRYFRLYVVGLSGNDLNQYLDLFDALRKMKAYSSDLLLKRLKGKKIAGYLPTARHHLYRMILKSMRAYQAEKSPMRQLRGLILDGVYLYEKTLYQQSLKMMLKARKIAENIEDLNSLLEINTWERKLIKLVAGESHREKLEALALADGNLLAQKQDYHAHYGLLDRVYLLANRSLDSRKRELRELLDEIEAAPLLQQAPEGKGFHCLWFYHQTNAFSSHLKGDYVKARDYFAEAALLWESHPEMIKADVLAYRSLLANLTQISALLGQWDAVPPLMEKMRSLPVRSDVDQILLDQHLYQIELHRALNLGKLSEAESLAAAIGPWLNKHTATIAPGRAASFRYNLMVLYFVLGQFEESLSWSRELLEGSDSKVRSDLQQGARILQLLLYFELEEEDLLQYRFRSTYRHLYQRQEIHAFEASALGLLRKLARFHRDNVPVALLKEMLVVLEELHASPEAAGTPVLDELVYWVTSKVRNQSIREVVEEGLRR